MEYRTSHRGDGVSDLDALRVWAAEWAHLVDAARQVRRLFEEWDAANDEARRLREVLAACEASMDTAASHGAGDILPPAYREAWARRHLEARRVLAATAPAPVTTH